MEKLEGMIPITNVNISFYKVSWDNISWEYKVSY